MSDEEIRITSATGGEPEVRVRSKTGGEKGQKLARFDLLPTFAITEVAKLFGAGSMKYEDRNWERGFDWGLSFAAMQRHAWLFWGGESMDTETQRHHLASVIFHAMALMEFERTGAGTDSRSRMGQDSRPHEAVDQHQLPEVLYQHIGPVGLFDDPHDPATCHSCTPLPHEASCCDYACYEDPGCACDGCKPRESCMQNVMLPDCNLDHDLKSSAIGACGCDNCYKLRLESTTSEN